MKYMFRSVLFIVALVVIFLVALLSPVFGGEVGLPTETMGIPANAEGTIYVWDYENATWSEGSVSNGVFVFKVPAWNRWYWIGAWDVAGRCVYGRWLGHFLIPGEAGE